MDELILLSELYDYYHELLTDRQKLFFQKYYFENLTMQEIAEIEGISKNAVSKQIEAVKEKLIELESKLNLKAKHDLIIKLIEPLDKKTKEKIEKII